MVKNEKHRQNLVALSSNVSIVKPELLSRLNKADLNTPNLVVNTYLLRINCDYLRDFQIKRSQLRRSLNRSLASGSNPRCPAVENLKRRLAVYGSECQYKKLVIERLLTLLEDSLNETPKNRSNVC